MLYIIVGYILLKPQWKFMKGDSNSKYNEDTKYLQKVNFGQVNYSDFLMASLLDVSKLLC